MGGREVRGVYVGVVVVFEGLGLVLVDWRRERLERQDLQIVGRVIVVVWRSDGGLAGAASLKLRLRASRYFLKLCRGMDYVSMG